MPVPYIVCRKYHSHPDAAEQNIAGCDFVIWALGVSEYGLKGPEYQRLQTTGLNQ